MKTLGIIGGMGPLASADLFKKIVINTRAHSDREHLHVILDNDTTIPDRTAFLLHAGKDPRPNLCASARRLQDAGADVLVIACNTAHYFFDDVAAVVDIPVLHMPRLTADFIERKGFSTVALLATEGTIQSHIYQKAFAGHSTKLLVPDGLGQQAVMSLIYDGVKSGNSHFPTAGIRNVLSQLQEAGVEAFILGCTELPVAFPLYALPGRVIDPTLILAREAIRVCGASLIA